MAFRTEGVSLHRQNIHQSRLPLSLGELIILYFATVDADQAMLVGPGDEQPCDAVVTSTVPAGADAFHWRRGRPPPVIDYQENIAYDY